MYTRLVRIAMLFCLTFAITACGGKKSNPTGPGPNPGPSPAPQKVLLVTTGIPDQVSHNTAMLHGFVKNGPATVHFEIDPAAPSKVATKASPSLDNETDSFQIYVVGLSDSTRYKVVAHAKKGAETAVGSPVYFFTKAAPDTTPPNQPPVVDAGPDLSAEDTDGNGAETFVFTVTASDPDGVISSIESSEGAVNGVNGMTVTVELAVGTHTLTITVTDDSSATATDDVVLTVTANTPPTADAGSDQTVQDSDGSGTELVTLDGSGSSDSGSGSIVSYEWMMDGAVIAAGAVPSVELTVGTHTITLTVADNGGATAVDEVEITVEPLRWMLASGAEIDGIDVDDETGWVYLAVNTRGTLDGTPNAGQYDFYAVALDDQGVRKWATPFKTPDSDFGEDITVNGDGVYTLHTRITDVINGPRFVTKYSKQTGDVLWVREFADMSLATGITADASGVYAIGGTSLNATAIKISHSGVEEWRHWSLLAADYSSITTTPTGDVWLAASTVREIPGAENAGGLDIMLEKIDSGGNLLKQVQWGTPAEDDVYGIALSGNILVVVGTKFNFNIGGRYLALGYNTSTEEFGWANDFGLSITEGLSAVTVAPNGDVVAGGGNSGASPILISPADGSYLPISPGIAIGKGGLAYQGNTLLVVNGTNVIHRY